MNCSRCGGPTIELFFSRACKAECDLKGTAWQVEPEWTDSDKNFSAIEQEIREILASSPPGLKFLRYDAMLTMGGETSVLFTGINNSAAYVLKFPLKRSFLESEMIKLSRVLSP